MVGEVRIVEIWGCNYDAEPVRCSHVSWVSFQCHGKIYHPLRNPRSLPSIAEVPFFSLIGEG